MYKLRAETLEDIESFREVNDLAFHYGDEAKLVDAIRKSDRFIPELSIVAVTEDKKVIGHILLSNIDIVSENATIPTLALAPMAVRPDFQGQGIGSALAKFGLAESKRLGFGHVVLIGHPDFYPRFGFASARERGLEAPIPVPDSVFLACELVEGALKDIGGTIQYPSTFYFDGKLI